MSFSPKLIPKKNIKDTLVSHPSEYQYSAGLQQVLNCYLIDGKFKVSAIFKNDCLTGLNK